MEVEAETGFAKAIAEIEGMTDDEFLDLGREISWLERNQPDTFDLAFDRATYDEAARRRGRPTTGRPEMT